MASAVAKRGIVFASLYVLAGVGLAFLSSVFSMVLAVLFMGCFIALMVSPYAREKLSRASTASPIAVGALGAFCSLIVLAAAIGVNRSERAAARKAEAEHMRIKKESETIQKAMKKAEDYLRSDDIPAGLSVLKEANDAKDGEGLSDLQSLLQNCEKALSDDFLKSTVRSMGDAEFQEFFRSAGKDHKIFDDEALNAAYIKRLLSMKGRVQAIREDEKRQIAVKPAVAAEPSKVPEPARDAKTEVSETTISDPELRAASETVNAWLHAQKAGEPARGFWDPESRLLYLEFYSVQKWEILKAEFVVRDGKQNPGKAYLRVRVWSSNKAGLPIVTDSGFWMNKAKDKWLIGMIGGL